MKKRLLAVTLAAAMLLGGCAGGTQTATTAAETTMAAAAEESRRVVTDMLGREVVLPDEINTIATFKAIGVLNTFVETLGAGDKICNGMTPSFTKGSHDMQYVFAPQIKDAPVLENADGEIQIEDVLALNPDLCLVAWEDGVKLLEDAGMCVVYVNWTDGDELKEAVTLLGEILENEDLAANYCRFFDDSVAKAESLTADLTDDEKRTVLYGSVKGLKNPHQISEWWIAKAGGISVTEALHAATDAAAVEYSIEDLLAWDPDVMFLTSNEKDELLADSNYASLKAIKNGDIYRVPTVGHTWGNRSTEQPLTILWALNKMYPDRYSTDELKEDISTFYSTFFQCDLTQEQLDKIVG